jgi:hypothetical protein
VSTTNRTALSRWTLAAASAVAGLTVAALLIQQLERTRAERAYLERGSGARPRELLRIATLPPALRESSGIAASRTQAGVLWSHNDSGDNPTIYAVDLSGRLLAIVDVVRATARDWEDIALGPCPPGFATDGDNEPRPRPCLYAADIGDNSASRDALTVYVIAEPRLASRDGGRISTTARHFRYRYPVGPQDSEALAVGPDGDVLIVTKGRSGPIGFFGISADRVSQALRSGEILVAERLGPPGLTPVRGIGRLVTGAAISPDGATLAVRTYHEVFFYRRADKPVGRRWQLAGRPCFLGYAERQGEAIAFLDASTLVTTSERQRGLSAQMYLVRC